MECKVCNSRADWKDMLFGVARVALGLLFSVHGLMKLGAFGSGAATFGLMWWVGIGELLVGLGIAAGVLVRVAAAGGIVIMIAAQIMAHIPKGWSPYSNGGELSLVFLVAFLMLLAYGARGLSLEKAVLKKECV